MAAVQVEAVTQAKTGKSLRVMLGGTWYGAALDSGLADKKGSMIVAEIETGKYGPWIKKWLPSTDNAAPQVPVAHAGTPPPLPAAAAPYTREPQYAEPAKPGTVAPYWLPMASNVVAHAIAAGKIETPAAIKTWVQAVKNAVENVDDIPF